MGTKKRNRTPTGRLGRKTKTAGKDGNVTFKSTQEIVKDCIVEYGKYAIENRALPDARDGLKPSVRRILWAMYNLNALSSRPPVKSGRIVGETIGKYHPHGDAAVYQALVLLAHDKDRLIIPDGNFGDFSSYQKRPAASSRYTECRLSKLAESLFIDIDIVQKTKNYDATLDEPVILPVRIPLSLIKGTDGIAVGLSTNIPPHNLHEVIDACCHLIDNPDATTKDLLKFIKGPDYGSGVLLSSEGDLLRLYETGEGSLHYSSEYHIETNDDEQLLVITAFAPEMRGRRSKLLDTSISCFKAGLIDSPITDETTLENGQRFTIKFSDGRAVKDRILPLLDSKISYKWYCLDINGKPKKYNLRSLLVEFIVFRREIESGRLTRSILAQRKLLATQIAKYKAAKHAKEVVKILQTAEGKTDAIESLCTNLGVTKQQADIILNANISTLLRSDIDKIVSEIKKTKQKINALREDLANIDDVIKRHLLEIKPLGKKRGTKLCVKPVSISTIENIQYWVGAGQETVSVFKEIPTNTKAAWSYTSFEKASERAVVVYDTNIVSVLDTSYADRYEKQPGSIVGISTKKYCLVLSTRNYVLFPSDQRRKIFKAFKKDDNPLFAVGVNDEDTILIICKNGRIIKTEVSNLKVTRPNVLPKRIGRSDVKKVLVLSPGNVLLSDNGRRVEQLSITTRKNLSVAGNKNFVVFLDGKRKVLSLSDTISAIKRKEVKVYYAIST